MIKTEIRKPILFFAVLLSAVVVWSNFAQGAADGLGGAWGPKYRARPRADQASKRAAHQANAPTTWVLHWNEIAINASGLDHTPIAPGESRIFGEQFGPNRASRAMAIVHIAIFEAVNAIDGNYKSYIRLAPSPWRSIDRRRPSPKRRTIPW